MSRNYKHKQYNVTVNYLNQTSIEEHLKNSVDEIIVPKVLKEISQKYPSQKESE